MDLHFQEQRLESSKPLNYTEYHIIYFFISKAITQSLKLQGKPGVSKSTK